MKRCERCKILLLDDTAKYCDGCKKLIAGESDASACADASAKGACPSESDEQRLAGSTLRLGILGLAFSQFPFLSVPGFVLSILACARAGSYERTFGALRGRAKIGSVLGRLGRVFGLVWNIAIAVYFTYGASLWK